MQRYSVNNFNEILHIILFYYFFKHKSINANKYIQLTKYDKNIKRNKEW